jgi:mannose-P-dolichol utilization defect protein 1
MNEQCFESIFIKFEFTNVDCLKMIVSKGLGYGILAGSLLLRVPQILKILLSQSGKGISVVSEILMLIAIFGSMSYGFFKEFSIAAYGDTYFLYLQGIIVLLLVLYYDRNFFLIFLILPAVGIASYLLYAKMIPAQVILTLNALSVFLSVISRLNQAFANFMAKSTGNLSAITLILQFLGCVARIFTSIQETGDTNLIISYIINSVVNGILVLQLFYYWNSDKAHQKLKKKTQ